MADERKIVIELRTTGSNISKEKSGEEEERESLSDALRIMQNPTKTLEKATLGKSVIAYYLWNETKQFAKTTALYQIHRYYNLTENYKAEQDLENTMSVLQKMAEGYTSIIGGAIIGAKAGPWGALAGGAIAAASWGVNTAFNAWKSFDQQNMQLSTMNIQSSYQKVRLGLIDNGRGTEN